MQCSFCQFAVLPFGTAVAMIAFFGAVGIFATFGAFSSNDRLEESASFIGTKNPVVARIVCLIVAVLSWTFVGLTIASLAGALD